MNKDIYNVGILGCANIAIRSILPTLTSLSYYHIKAIASREKQKAIHLAEKYSCIAYGDYDELLNNNDIDLVYIPLPTGLHYEWVIKALNSGKHVMCEKSLGTNYLEVMEMVKLAKEKKLLLIENFQFRFHSQHAWVRSLIDKGELGNIRCFRSSFGFPPFSDRNNIRYIKELGGGALLDAGAYTLKVLDVILPDYEFKMKSASLHPLSNTEVDLWGGVFLESNEGIIAEMAFGFDNYYQCNYEIWGSKGKLTVMRAFTAPSELNPIAILEKQSYKEEIVLQKDNHFRNMFLHIKSCLDSGNFESEYRQNLKQSLYIQQIKDYCYGK